MICMFPVYRDDVHRLLNLLNWICQLGGCKQHDAVVVADAATPTNSCFQLLQEARKSFSKVNLITTEKSVNGWPQGPNELFVRAANYALETGKHWLFLEPDSVPLKPWWLDTLDIHYRKSGYRYFGHIVPCKQAGLPEKHFTGVGIYPHDAIKDIGTIISKNGNIAFDISTANVLVPKAKHSTLFQHLWGETNNPPKFADNRIVNTSTFSLNYLRDDAVIFHRTKDGSLIHLLRREFGVYDPNVRRLPYLQMGRYGDIILLLPALKYIADTSIYKPKLICSTDYSSVLEGVSYVESVPMKLNWWSGIRQAINIAQQEYGGCTVLQCHGIGWGVDINQWDCFMTSMIDRTGVPLEIASTLPLVFDKRSPQRENQLIPKIGNMPYIVVNTTGNSSPFPFSKQLFALCADFSSKLRVVDIGKLRCHRIYDILGLMDNAIGSIHIDTASLHLAHACPKPHIAFTVDGWCSSRPMGNCVLEVKYSKALESLSRIHDTIASWL